MTKTIDTLVSDIEEVLKNGAPEGASFIEAIHHLSSDLSSVISGKLNDRDKKGLLRMSNIGTPCNRKLWYTVNTPEDGEELKPEVYLKFLYGDMIEELVLFLAELAGHTVEGRQDEQEIEGIKGHRDAIIDGMLVDVKSASTYSFNKFKQGKLEEDDPFGYVDQLQSYLHASQNDPLLKIKDKAAFLVIDKTLGHICLDVHQKKDIPFEEYFNYKKEIVAQEEPPSRKYEPIPEGKSGNTKLSMNCSYCQFKKKCWPQHRTFLYANNKVVHLVDVEKEPRVPELSENG